VKTNDNDQVMILQNWKIFERHAIFRSFLAAEHPESIGHRVAVQRIGIQPTMCSSRLEKSAQPTNAAGLMLFLKNTCRHDFKTRRRKQGVAA
jgi:hypothetical protein